jgi:hypothetical protein
MLPNFYHHWMLRMKINLIRIVFDTCGTGNLLGFAILRPNNESRRYRPATCFIHGINFVGFKVDCGEYVYLLQGPSAQRIYTSYGSTSPKGQNNSVGNYYIYIMYTSDILDFLHIPVDDTRRPYVGRTFNNTRHPLNNLGTL